MRIFKFRNKKINVISWVQYMMKLAQIRKIRETDKN